MRTREVGVRYVMSTRVSRAGIGMSVPRDPGVRNPPRPTRSAVPLVAAGR
jgi:hypothetical protein